MTVATNELTKNDIYALEDAGIDPKNAFDPCEWYVCHHGYTDDRDGDRFGPSASLSEGTMLQMAHDKCGIEESGYGYVLSKEAYENQQLKQDAQEVESRMATIMHKAGINDAFTGAFIKAVLKETRRVSDDWQDQLNCMEEDGLCGGWGMTSEQYFNDREYMQGRMMSDLEEVDILQTMEKHFPLRMAKAWDEYHAMPKEDDGED